MRLNTKLDELTADKSAFLLILILALFFNPLTILAQQTVKPPVALQQNDSPAKPREQLYQGPLRCGPCHSVESKTALPVFRDFATQNEASTFIKQDKHSQAFLLLKGERGQQIGRLLGKDVTQERQCLSCHANWQKDQPERPPYFENGVSCESCHGPSLHWDQPHSDRKWRLESPAAKQDKGMVDVRNPIKRAEQCFSCHIGNGAEGKVITHAMYAAGHPPLPGIEIESFAEQMPAHWRTLAEKGPFEHREAYLKVNSPHNPSGGDWPRTKNVIVSGMVALRESLELIADQANQEQEWPELAAFDCQSCHHDLRSPSWRQERIPLAGPGRPPLPEWPFALVKTGLRQIAGDDTEKLKALQQEFTKRRQALYASIQKQPFGERVATQAAIREFLEWLTPNITTLEQSTFDAAAARRASQELMSLEPAEFPDFHSARQRVWALGVIHQELDPGKESLDFAAIPVRETMLQRRNREEANIQKWLDWRETVLKPKRQKWAADWSDPQAPFQLPLLLPAGIGKLNENEDPQALIVDNLPQSLQTISNYDAAKFRIKLEQMRESAGARAK